MLKFCVSTFRSVRSWDTSGGWSPRASRKDFPWPNFFRWVIFAKTGKNHWKNSDKADKFLPTVVFWFCRFLIHQQTFSESNWLSGGFKHFFLLFIPIYLEKIFLKPFWRWFIFFIHGLEPQPPTSDFCVLFWKTGRQEDDFHQLRLNHWLLGLNQQPEKPVGCFQK